MGGKREGIKGNSCSYQSDFPISLHAKLNKKYLQSQMGINYINNSHIKRIKNTINNN